MANIDIKTFATHFSAAPMEGQAPLGVQFTDEYPVALIIETSDESIMDAELIEMVDNAELYGQEMIIEERSL